MKTIVYRGTHQIGGNIFTIGDIRIRPLVIDLIVRQIYKYTLAFTINLGYNSKAY